MFRGLDIVSFGGAGINIMFANGSLPNVIESNYIGFIPGEVVPHGNGDGILTSASALHTVIGGTTASQRNVISGNVYDGIYLEGVATVTGNYIGTTPAGNASKPNGRYGIAIGVDGSTNKIGGVARVPEILLRTITARESQYSTYRTFTPCRMPSAAIRSSAMAGWAST